MIRHFVSTLGGLALAAAVTLALALPADAQQNRGVVRPFGGGYPGGQYGGFQPGYVYPGYGGYYQTPGAGYVYPGNYVPYQQYAMPQAGYVQPGQAAPAGGVTQSLYQSAGNAARLTVRLPANAQLWVEDYQTRQTGPVRVLTSPPIQPGQTYHYTLKAQWDENGKPVTQERTANFQAGSDVAVDFTQPESQGTPKTTAEPIGAPKAPATPPAATPPPAAPPG